MTKSEVNTLIRSRRAVFPQMYNKEEITDAEIKDILENANWAPTHKKTEPWRYIVFRGEALVSLGEWLAAKYRETATKAWDCSDARYEKFLNRPLQCGCVLGICMLRDPAKRLPKWEELAALACSVENMWLTCTAYGIGAYWSTPGFVVDAKDFPHLKDGWKCKGLFYMGRWDEQELPAKRGAIGDKIEWIDTTFTS
jgi:nitroreductase